MLPSVQLPSSNTIWCQFDLEKTSSVHCICGHSFPLLHSLLYCACLSAYDSVIKLGQEEKKKPVWTAQKMNILGFQIHFFNKISSTCRFVQQPQICSSLLKSWILESTQGTEGRHWGRNKRQRTKTGEGNSSGFNRSVCQTMTSLWHSVLLSKEK